MERKLSTIMIILITVLIIPSAYGVKITKINDKSKMYQIRSMENGKWEFHPGWYYVLLHKEYSGGYYKGLHIKWSVSKSKVGQVGHLRLEQAALETTTATHVKSQVDTVQPLAEEELIRFAEREIDAAYLIYSPTFKEYLNKIESMLNEANRKSEGMLASQICCLIDEKELIEEEIAYIHSFGPTSQMENAKRELAYEEVESKLRRLSDRVYKLLYYSQTIKNANH